MNDKVIALRAKLKEMQAAYADDPAMRARIDTLAGCICNVDGRLYSLHNILVLIDQAAQRGMIPQQLAGFQAWREHGRSVRKGEKGFMIFAPHRHTVEVQERDDDDTYLFVSCRRLFDSDLDDPELRVGFHLMYVFDRSQTDPLPGKAEQ